MNPRKPGGRGATLPRLLPALALLTVASVGIYACTEKPKEVTAPNGLPAFDLGPAPGWDLNDSNTPTTTNPDTATVTSDGGYAGLWIFPTPFKVGTGLLNPFLSVQHNGVERGFNTDNGSPYDDKSGSAALPLNWVPIIKGPGGLGYREFILDANENNSGTDWRIAIDTFDVYVCDDNGADQYTTFGQFDNTSGNVNCKRVYDLGGKIGYASDALTSGSGKTLDYDILIPEKAFTDAFSDAETVCPYAGVTAPACGYWVIVKTKMGGIVPPADSTWQTDATFEEFSTLKRPYVSVSKVAHTSYTRTWLWQIDKSPDTTNIVMYTGESDSTHYFVKVDTTGHTDSNILVTDTVTISNNSGSAAPIQDFSDLMGPISIDYTCMVGASTISFPYDLADKATIICTSSASPPDLTAREDTATVTLADSVGGSVFRATAPVTFGAPTTVVNDSVNVVDTFKGTLGGLSAMTGTITFDYWRPFTCDGDKGEHWNTATITETAQKDSAVTIVACANLTVSKTVVDSLTRTWNWTIDKSVDPDRWDIFTGDSATSNYQVVLDKTDSTDSNWKVNGAITVHNPGDVDITLDSLVDYISGAPTKATVSCDSLKIASGGQLDCTYTANLPNGSTQDNVVTAWVGTHSWADTVAVDFSTAGVTEVNDSVHVTDTFNGALGTALGDTTFTYDRTFRCDEDQGAKNNTATITETGDTAMAKVTVNCYGLQVSKTADDSLQRHWKIAKDIDATYFSGPYDPNTVPPTATVMSTEDLMVHYNIVVDTAASSDFKVYGGITIKNLNPSLGADVNISDVVSPSIAATLDCGAGGTSTTIAKGDSLKCTYYADLPNANTRTDTAKAVLTNHYFTAADTTASGGTQTYWNTALSDFSTATKVDDCVQVWDILAHSGGAQIDSTQLTGSICTGDTLPHTFTYVHDFGPNGTPLVCGNNYFDNTGWLKTNDTGTTADSTASINIYVNCPTGCTLTQGYWKTHNATFASTQPGKGPPPDTIWNQLPGGQAENTTFFFSGQTWYEVFWFKAQGNPYYTLAVQYMAAVLNGLAGADTSAVSSELTDAYNLFNNPTNTPDYVAGLKGQDKHTWIDLAKTLDNYNNGLIGPGHCTENPPPG